MPAVPDDIAILFDPVAFAIVVIGTMIAAVIRAGPADCGKALASAARLPRRGFDADASRAALASFAALVRKRGLRAADPPSLRDPPLCDAIGELVASASRDEMLLHFDKGHESRAILRERSIAVFEQAGELAPVLGLAGTLFAMTGIESELGVAAASSPFAPIAAAVLSTLYGILLAHFVCLPIAAAIARRGGREEADRALLLDWLWRELGRENGRGDTAKLQCAA